MAKKNGFAPFILLSSGEPGDDIVIGGGTGQGGVNPVVYPMGFDAWYASDWAEDYVPATEGIDMVDYVVWFFDCGFTMAQFQEVNPGVAWDPTWDDYL